jgi:hypothetical protein
MTNEGFVGKKEKKKRGGRANAFPFCETNPNKLLRRQFRPCHNSGG